MRMPTARCGRQRNRRFGLSLTILALAWLSITPAAGAFVDQPVGGLTEVVCHNEATVLLVAGQFGSVLIVSGRRAPILADVAWRAIEKTPPVTTRIYIVIGRDGLVRLYAANRGCVRRAMAATLPTWLMIIGKALERFPDQQP